MTNLKMHSAILTDLSTSRNENISYPQNNQQRLIQNIPAHSQYNLSYANVTGGSRPVEPSSSWNSNHHGLKRTVPSLPTIPTASFGTDTIWNNPSAHHGLHNPYLEYPQYQPYIFSNDNVQENQPSSSFYQMASQDYYPPVNEHQHQFTSQNNLNDYVGYTPYAYGPEYNMSSRDFTPAMKKISDFNLTNHRILPPPTYESPTKIKNRNPHIYETNSMDTPKTLPLSPKISPLSYHLDTSFLLDEPVPASSRYEKSIHSKGESGISNRPMISEGNIRPETLPVTTETAPPVLSPVNCECPPEHYVNLVREQHNFTHKKSKKSPIKGPKSDQTKSENSHSTVETSQLTDGPDPRTEKTVDYSARPVSTLNKANLTKLQYEHSQSSQGGLISGGTFTGTSQRNPQQSNSRPQDSGNDYTSTPLNEGVEDDSTIKHFVRTAASISINKDDPSMQYSGSSLYKRQYDMCEVCSRRLCEHLLTYPDASKSRSTMRHLKISARYRAYASAVKDNSIPRTNTSGQDGLSFVNTPQTGISDNSQTDRLVLTKLGYVGNASEDESSQNTHQTQVPQYYQQRNNTHNTQRKSFVSSGMQTESISTLSDQHPPGKPYTNEKLEEDPRTKLFFDPNRAPPVNSVFPYSAGGDSSQPSTLNVTMLSDKTSDISDNNTNMSGPSDRGNGKPPPRRRWSIFKCGKR